jgi:hypothetical protein
VVVRSGAGEELARFEREGDVVTASAFGGRAVNVTDMAKVRAQEDGAFVELGDPRAFSELEATPEYAQLPWLSRELGVQGFSGRAFPATLGLHMMAQQAARDLSIDVPTTPTQPTAGDLGTTGDGTAQTASGDSCVDLRGDPGNNDSLGMCGPGKACWDWVCGDCCCHDGCLSHDYTCRNCHWYKPWNCILCATFTSFLAGTCGTSCQADLYGEPACHELGTSCSQDADCCGHYPDADEANAGAPDVECIDGACKLPGSCAGACGGYAGGCWCDAACSAYGDCCGDVGSCAGAPVTPAVSNAGLGCDHGQCVWAVGSGFTRTCHVDFHQVDGTVYSADGNCSDTLVTCVIPPEVLNIYGDTWIAVVNEQGQWNSGYHLSLPLPPPPPPEDPCPGGFLWNGDGQCHECWAWAQYCYSSGSGDPQCPEAAASCGF